jgi:hypothetical protein
VGDVIQMCNEMGSIYDEGKKHVALLPPILSIRGLLIACGQYKKDKRFWEELIHLLSLHTLFI